MGAGCLSCACDTGHAREGASRVGKQTVGCLAGICRGFKEFITRGNVVDLAVAIVVGSSFTALVNALVADFITPFIAVAFDPNSVFGDLTFTINGSIFRYGHFLNVALTFMLVCLILYFLVVLPTNQLMALVTGPKKARTCPECCGDVPLKARRCKWCCTALELEAPPLQPPGAAGSLKPLGCTEDEEMQRAKTAPARVTVDAHTPAQQLAPASACDQV